MSLLFEALQPSIPSDVLALQTSPGFGVDGAFHANAYSLSVDAAAQAICLDFRDPSIAAGPIAADASRAAAAAFQTFSTIESDPTDADEVCWRLIKLYYSAFYSAHALTRYLGRSFSYIAAQNARRLNTEAAALGLALPFQVTKGQYDVVLASSMIQIRGTSNATPHEGFWKAFSKELTRLETAISTGPLPRLDAQVAIQKLSELRSVLSRQSKVDGWLCFVRNELQYRHSMGVWYPTRAKKTLCTALDRKANQWHNDPMSIVIDSGTDIVDFAAACVFLVALCRSTTVGLAAKSVGGRSFVARGPLRLLRELERA